MPLAFADRRLASRKVPQAFADKRLASGLAMPVARARRERSCSAKARSEILTPAAVRARGP